TNLFIESDREQANQIAECTGKLCFCASTDELFGLERKNNFKIKHSKWFVLRRLLAALVPVRGLRRKIRGV
ncbi:MAG: hypothetical protein IKV10_03520, partial [Alphaproteobacteria bacterium]|nr:hypothetical protein [Alphaproteobacteria bacterium]